MLLRTCVLVFICGIAVHAELAEKASSNQLRVLVDSADVFTASSQLENRPEASGVEVTISSNNKASSPSVRSEGHVVTVKFGGKVATFNVNFEGNQMLYSRTVDSPITMQANHITDLQSMRQSFQDFATGKSTASHKHLGLAERVLSWLSDAQPGYVIDSFEHQPTTMSTNIKPTLQSDSKAPEAEGNQLRGVSCPGTSAVISNEVACPATSNVLEADEGATCMCPYSGTTPRDANYDFSSASTAYSWRRPYGSATSSCLGRCGAGCNFLDKEAFKDCFDHDTCIDHFGGSSLAGSPDCGDEFNHAADDYIVSYGASCC